MVRKILRINSSKLIEVILEVANRSYKQSSDKTSSWNTDLAIPYLKQQKLDEHIFFQNAEHKFPLNSERKTYDYLNNIIVRNLEIDLKLTPEWENLLNWKLTPIMKWHFESCHIKPMSPNSGNIIFPWSSSFRFYKNIFEFPRQGMRTWLFSFGIGSHVLFQKNNFELSDIQITDSFREEDTSLEMIKVDEFKHIRAYYLKDDSYIEAIIRKEHGLPDSVKVVIPDSHSRHIGMRGITFLGNKGINSLFLRCEAANYVFNGLNQINRLSFNVLNYKNTGVNFYFSSREKIDPNFNHVFPS